jgi:hypothetical protein
MVAKNLPCQQHHILRKLFSSFQKMQVIVDMLKLVERNSRKNKKKRKMFFLVDSWGYNHCTVIIEQCTMGEMTVFAPD